MSESETPAPEQVTVDPNVPAPTAPELDVTQPVPPPEPAPLPAEPSVPATETSGAPPAEVTVEQPSPASDVLQGLLEELRDLKAKIVAAIGG